MNLAFQTLWLRLPIQEWKSGHHSSEKNLCSFISRHPNKNSQINGNVLVATKFLQQINIDINIIYINITYIY